MKNSEFINKITVILLSCFVISVVFLFLEIKYNVFIFVLALGGYIYLIKRSIMITTQKNILLASIFSVFLSASVVIGKKIDFINNTFISFEWNDFFYWIILGFFFLILTMNALNYIEDRIVYINESMVSKKLWLCCFIIIALAWLPYLFIYFPGNLFSDSFWHISQCIGTAPINNHHPIMYTLFIKFFIKIVFFFGGDLNLGIGLFSFSQLLLLAAILSYSLYWMKKKGAKNYVVILTGLYFSLNPVIARYAITMWKDTFFGGVMLLLVLFIFDAIESDGKTLISFKGLTILVGLSFALSFIRNNGIYIIAIVLLVLFLYFKRFYKKLVPVFFVTVLIILLIQGPIYDIVGVERGEFVESLGIPLEQIGYTIVENGTIDESEMNYISNLIPIERIKEVYNPFASDYIKFDEEFNNAFLESEKLGFFKMWMKILPHNLKNYIEAYLMATSGYWYYDIKNWIVTDQNPLVLESGLVTFTNLIEKGTSINFKNGINEIIEVLRSIPIISNFFSVGSMVWIMFFNIIVMIYTNNKKWIIPMVPLISLWMTMMIATPIFCEFRYMFSFHLLMPFLLVTIFVRTQKKNDADCV